MRQVRAGSKRGFDENQNGHAKMPKFDSEVFHFLIIRYDQFQIQSLRTYDVFSSQHYRDADFPSLITLARKLPPVRDDCSFIFSLPRC